MILELIDRLAREAAKLELEFLLIGGHAVARHGHPRMTLDIDFLVKAEQRAIWNELLSSFGYSCYSEGSAFAQFGGLTGWPRVDLMLCDESTFRKLYTDAEQSSGIRIPSVKHIIALKLHAASSADRSKPAQDWEDITHLVRLHQLDPAEPEFKDLILRYGGQSALDRILALCNL